jgi:hypothetical protein
VQAERPYRDGRAAAQRELNSTIPSCRRAGPIAPGSREFGQPGGQARPGQEEAGGDASEAPGSSRT